MRDAHQWQQTKFELHRGGWRGSRNARELAPGSRLGADLVARAYERHVPAHVAGRTLDLGCGKCPLYGMVRGFADAYYATDWPESLHGNRHVDVLHDLNRPLPFAAASFRTILLADVLEHLYQPWKLWEEMGRILQPRGKVLANVPFLYWVHEEPHDYYRFTEFALVRMAEAAGFRVCALEALGGSVAVLADLVAKHLQALPLVGAGLAALAQALVPARLAAKPWPRSPRALALFPLAYFLVAEKVEPAFAHGTHR